MYLQMRKPDLVVTISDTYHKPQKPLDYEAVKTYRKNCKWEPEEDHLLSKPYDNAYLARLLFRTLKAIQVRKSYLKYKSHDNIP